MYKVDLECQEIIKTPDIGISSEYDYIYLIYWERENTTWTV